MAVWREAITGTLAGNAVDMTLRVDDARASPTCHRVNNRNRRLAWCDREDGTGQPSNQEQWSSGPAEGVHWTGTLVEGGAEARVVRSIAGEGTPSDRPPASKIVALANTTFSISYLVRLLIFSY